MKNLQYLAWGFIVVCMGVGILIAKWMIPDLSWSAVAASIGGTVAGVGLVAAVAKIREMKKRDHVPDVDERTWNNMKNFYAAALYFVLIGSMAVVIVLVGLGHETIELGAISLYLLFLFMILAIGSFLVKRA
ncbi:hypothetical protein [Cytobacillus gottheilii]|uniref:DUF2178 domain-containing protein n=1 Tax=Cytobacillus gottheilii TaxID=859144 RepID=A0ABX8FCA1_9BACI|nr:hypothetical protein [Cytobacillus gottheilii]QVY61849.1 hypothetical protein J1899_01565 [Cytobacillus gottheilii]